MQYKLITNLDITPSGTPIPAGTIFSPNGSGGYTNPVSPDVYQATIVEHSPDTFMSSTAWSPNQNDMVWFLNEFMTPVSDTFDINNPLHAQLLSLHAIFPSQTLVQQFQSQVISSASSLYGSIPPQSSGKPI
jgi:hypothetical protein